MTGYADDLLGSLMDETEEEAITPVTDLIPNEIHLTHRNLILGQRIGPETQKQGNAPLEVGGFYSISTKKKNQRHIAYLDFIIPKDLPVSSGDIVVAENYDDAAKELHQLNPEMRLGAMFHIHPHKNGGLYHSQDDDKQLHTLVNKMAKNTRTVHQSRFQLIESAVRQEYGQEDFSLKGDELSDAIQKFVYPDSESFFELLLDFGFKPDMKHFKKEAFLAKLLSLIDMQTYEPRLINFATSFVFNNSEDTPYVKMGYQETFKLSGITNYDTVENIPIRIIEQGQNLPTKEEVAALVKERVKFPAHRIYYPRGRSARKGANSAVVYPSYGENFYNYAYPTGSYGQREQLRKRTVQQRLDQILDLQNGTDEQLFEAVTQGTSTASNKKKPQIETVEKTKDLARSDERIITQFSLALINYAAQYEDADCGFSTYAATLIDQMAVYSGSWNAAAKNYAPKGLLTAILAAGEPLLDHPKLVEQHNLPLGNIDYLKRNIEDELEELPENVREFTLNFMDDFITADLKGQEKTLIDYVTSIQAAASRSDDKK